VVLHPAYRSTDVHEDTPISSNILYDTHFLLYTPFSAVPSAIEKHFCATVLYYTTLYYTRAVICYTPLNYTTQHCTVLGLYYTPQHYTLPLPAFNAFFTRLLRQLASFIERLNPFAQLNPFALRPTTADDAWDPAIWKTFFSTTLGLEVPVLSSLPRHHHRPAAKCGSQ